MLNPWPCPGGVVFTRSVTVQIFRPPDEVFAFVADARNRPLWDESVDTEELTSPSPLVWGAPCVRGCAPWAATTSSPGRSSSTSLPADRPSRVRRSLRYHPGVSTERARRRYLGPVLGHRTPGRSAPSPPAADRAQHSEEPRPGLPAPQALSGDRRSLLNPVSPASLGTAIPAPEPSHQCAEHEPDFRRQGGIGGQADDDPERQTGHSPERNRDSDAHTRECMVGA
jgi:Polyketide cyclase / dehydrase and lipid transport